MPHHKSAEKRLRQTEKRTAVNRARMSRVRTFVKKVESAIETGDKAAAQSAFQQAQPELEAGRLVRPVPHWVRANRSYYIVYPEDIGPPQRLLIFRDWLLCEAGKYAQTMSLTAGTYASL